MGVPGPPDSYEKETEGKGRGGRERGGEGRREEGETERRKKST